MRGALPAVVENVWTSDRVAAMGAPGAIVQLVDSRHPPYIVVTGTRHMTWHRLSGWRLNLGPGDLVAYLDNEVMAAIREHLNPMMLYPATSATDELAYLA